MGFPATTELSEENLDAVLGYMRRTRGYDFVEIRFGPAEQPVALATIPTGKAVRSSLNKKEDRPDLSEGKGKALAGQPMLDYSK